MKKIIELPVDPVELALRIADASCGMCRGPDQSKEEAWASLEQANPQQAARFMRAAEAAMRYVVECISKAPNVTVC